MFLILFCPLYKCYLGRRKVFFVFGRVGRGRSERVMGVKIELTEEVKREGDGAREGEEGSHNAFSRAIVSFGDAGMDKDLVLSMYISALLRPECFCVCSSSSSSLLLFKDEARGGGISSTSIAVSGCCCFFCYCCCCFCG